MIDRKVSLLPILFLFSIGHAFGQQSSEAEHRLSVHVTTTNLFDRADKTFAVAGDSGEPSSSAFFPSGFNVGLSYTRIRPNQYYYRVGLIGLKIDERRVRDSDSAASGEDSHHLNEITTQFEMGKYFGWRKVNVGTGLFVRPSYLSFQQQPESVLLFPLSIRDVTLDAGINGIVSYAFSEHLHMTVQVPVVIGRGHFTATHSDNPFLMEAQRGYRDFAAAFDVNIGLELGVAVGF